MQDESPCDPLLLLLPLYCYSLISYLPFNFLGKPATRSTNGTVDRQLLPLRKGLGAFSLCSSVFATSVFFSAPLLVPQTWAQGQQPHSGHSVQVPLPDSSKPAPARGSKLTTAALRLWAPSEKLLRENPRSPTTLSPPSPASWSAHEPGPTGMYRLQMELSSSQESWERPRPKGCF